MPLEAIFSSMRRFAEGLRFMRQEALIEWSGRKGLDDFRMGPAMPAIANPSRAQTGVSPGAGILP